MKARINQNSVIKRSDDVYACQVIVTLNDGHDVAFAVCTHRNGQLKLTVDTSKIYQYIGGAWKLIEVGEEMLALVVKTFDWYAKSYGHLFKRKMTDQKGVHWVMYSDTHLGGDDLTTWQMLKIGDLLIKATRSDFCDTYKFAARPFGNVSDDLEPYVPPPGLRSRIDKQLEFGLDAAARRRSSKPIGFRSWDDLADFRHSRGEFAQNARDYRRFKGVR